MQTVLLVTSTTRDRTRAVAEAVALLKRGEIVALPTETVYGLAADAMNPIAVARIFEAKERPRFDPLIVHLPRRDWLEKIAELPAQDRQLILNLADKFWPGPFTMVLRKREIVPEIVTAGLDTVAVRISAHPVFSEVALAFGKPLAAPSANRFGRVSPTTAQHVLDELGGRIPLIIAAGPTQHGIESTIIAVRDHKVDILRRGPITAEQLSQFGKLQSAVSARRISAPGQLPSHYAPKTPLRLIDSADTFTPQQNQRVGLLAWAKKCASPSARRPRRSANRRPLKFAVVRYLSEAQDLCEAAANLFRYLRELDQSGVDLIVAERVPLQGLGAAIMDRLQRGTHARWSERDRPE
jgi:L-threonylcarbamoyladenylate synthase